jgi:hypothetical protein
LDYYQLENVLDANRMCCADIARNCFGFFEENIQVVAIVIMTSFDPTPNALNVVATVLDSLE